MEQLHDLLTCSKSVGEAVDQHQLQAVLSSHMVPPDELSTVRVVGRGNFASVELAMHAPSGGREPRKVAVKRVKPTAADADADKQDKDLKVFLNEVYVLSRLSHRCAGERGGGGVAGGWDPGPGLAR